MVFQDSQPLFTPEELNHILSYWDEERSVLKDFQNRRYKSCTWINIDNKYKIRLLEWFEQHTNLKLTSVEDQLILHKFSKGDYFDIHKDNQTKEHGKRLYAVGFTVQNSNEGGEFIILQEDEEYEVGDKPGVPYLFSSEVAHRINKVKTGERFSILMFIYSDFISKSFI